MYDMTYLYVLIKEGIKECINFKDYNLSNIDNLGDDIFEFEDGLKEDILCNNDFMWYEEDGRKKLCEAVMYYKGRSFADLSEALQNENETAELIFQLIFDKVCNELIKDRTDELKRG